MIAVVRPCVLIAVATVTLLLAACGRGQPAPAKPEPPVATDTPPATSPARIVAVVPPPKPVAYKVEGGADDWHGTGIVCDFEKPFQLKGGGLTVHFTPTSKDGGTYKYDGHLSGFGVRGGEAYSVEWIGSAPVRMKGWGVGTVDTPMGPQSDNGVEHYTIERTFDACPAA